MYVSEIRNLISSFISNDISNMDGHLKWDLLKCEICKFTIDYTSYYIFWVWNQNVWEYFGR